MDFFADELKFFFFKLSMVGPIGFIGGSGWSYSQNSAIPVAASVWMLSVPPVEPIREGKMLIDLLKCDRHSLFSIFSPCVLPP